MGQLNYPPNKIPANVDPPGTRCIQITIPDDDEWESLMYSVIYRNLAMVWTNWKRTGDRTGADLNIRWRQALRTWKHCDGPSPIFGLGEDEDMPALYEPYCRDDGTCGFHFRCDICGSWHDVATVDQLNATQPAAGSPQPAAGGGQTCYDGKMDAKNTWLVPALVNSGDVFHMTSMGGAEYDGGGDNWRCPDGSAYAAGFCIPTNQIHKSGDPSASAFHMALIVVIDGTAYPLTQGDFTVPGGVSNAQAVIQANDSDITNNQGSFSFNVCVTNNQAAPVASWCHISNDLSDLATFWGAADGPGTETYSSGAWHSYYPSGSVTALQLVTAGTLNASTIINKIVFNTTGCAGNGSALLYHQNGTTLIQNNGAMTTEVQTFLVGNTTYYTGFYIDLVNGVDGTKNFSITSIEIHGTGPNPFGTSNC